MGKAKNVLLAPLARSVERNAVVQVRADVCNLPKAPKQGGAATYSGEYGAVIYGTNRGDGSIQDSFLKAGESLRPFRPPSRPTLNVFSGGGVRSIRRSPPPTSSPLARHPRLDELPDQHLPLGLVDLVLEPSVRPPSRPPTALRRRNPDSLHKKNLAQA